MDTSIPAFVSPIFVQRQIVSHDTALCRDFQLPKSLVLDPLRSRVLLTYCATHKEGSEGKAPNTSSL